MVTVLQAYDQVSDADAVVTARMDRRWQLVLGCLETPEAPVLPGRVGEIPRADDRARSGSETPRSHGGLGESDRPVRLAGAAGGAGFLAAGGPGRVEDTWNLLGRALRTVVTCAAKTLQIPREAVLQAPA